MKLEDFTSFLSRSGFKYNSSTKSYDKKVNDMSKRYVMKDNMVFMESKPLNQKEFKMTAYADIREVYVTDSDRLGGFKRYVQSSKGV